MPQFYIPSVFYYRDNAVEVTVNGAVCDVQSVSHTKIKCETRPLRPSTMATVDVMVDEYGMAVATDVSSYFT